MPTQPLPQIIPDILREVFLYFTPPKSSDPDLIPLDLFACSLLSSTTLCQMPTKTLPQLIPDILREVFLYFAPPNSSGPDLIPPDLFACSLVCKYWYGEACPLLDRYKFQQLTLNSRYTSDELKRIGGLFIEYRRNGQEYFNKIESVLVDIISLTASDPVMKLSMPAVQTILAHLPPKQTRLCIMPKFAGTPWFARSFLRKDIPSLLIMTHIHLHDNSSNPIPTRQNHINDVIASLSLRLESLKLTDVTFNAKTYDTLCLCTTLREFHNRRRHESYHDHQGARVSSTLTSKDVL
ncbi:hypothetical protein BC936DRAFT_141610 [Jimgerdemannia flammicorona]|uniref:F-box domain-containing protein n=1 Tax=Jimgerdemannia flammicorona TaxID=994334 RepID=A0A433DFW6_9FUNG|nr:hypothetical protein BC936DRAFT_141610 [Jimgerdemannia flammicorona]